MNAVVKIEGLEEVQAALTTAGPRLAGSTLYRALAAGGEVFVEEAKARAPVLAEPTAHRTPGELRDSITQVVTVDARRQRGDSLIGPAYDDEGKKSTDDPGVYGLFVEFGTKKMAAEPYMRPAFDAGQEDAARAFAAEFVRGVLGLKQP